MRKKLNYILISLIIGLSVAILFIAFTGPGNKTPGEGSPDFWKVSDSGVYFNVSGKNVGIGTNNPQYLLDVNGGIRIGNTFNIKEGVIRYRSDQKQFEGYDGSNWIPFAGNWTDQGNYIFARNTTSPNIVVVDDNGNVGIGTTSPSGELEIYKNSGTSDLVIRGDVASGSRPGAIWFFNDQSTDMEDNVAAITAEQEDADGGQLRFYTTDGETWSIVVIDKSGNVGIGTTSPGAKLEVNGAIYGKIYEDDRPYFRELVEDGVTAADLCPEGGTPTGVVSPRKSLTTKTGEEICSAYYGGAKSCVNVHQVAPCGSIIGNYYPYSAESCTTDFSGKWAPYYWGRPEYTYFYNVLGSGVGCYGLKYACCQ